MTRVLSAKAASFTDDGYCSVLAMTDDPDNPVYIVMLSITNDPDEQDLESGMGGIHLDLGEWKVDGYDLISDIQVTDTGIEISLVAEVASEGNVEVRLPGSVIDGVTIVDIVARFRERLAA